MKLVYNLSSRSFRCRCNETLEEQIFGTQAECVAWAKKVAGTLAVWAAADPTEGKVFTFTVTRVIEKSAEIWADENGLAGPTDQ